MHNYRFDLPVGARGLGVVISDAESLGGISDTTPWLKMIGPDKWQYQVVIKNLTKEDASYLTLKHNLTTVLYGKC